MRQHKLDFYMDGRVRVEFCRVCGLEGEQLRLECIGELPTDKNQKDFFKNVDKDEEPY